MSVKYPKLDTKGLTLTECVVSILVLSISLAGGLKLYFNGTSIMSSTLHKKMALEIATQEMEKIKDAGYNGVKNLAVDTDLPSKTFGLHTAEPFTTTLIHRRITDAPGIPAMKKVELEVSWVESNNSSRTIKLETLLSPPSP